MKTAERTEQLWESLLESAVIENGLRQAEEYPSDPELAKITLPPHYASVMNRFFKKLHRKRMLQPWIRLTKRTAAAILIFLGLCTALLLSSQEIRAALKNVWTSFHERYIEVVFRPTVDNSESPPEFDFYVEGFELVEHSEYHVKQVFVWENDNGNFIELDCIYAGGTIHFDNEHYIRETLQVNGHELTFLEATDSSFDNYITWNSPEIYYKLKSDMNKESLLKILKNWYN